MRSTSRFETFLVDNAATAASRRAFSQLQLSYPGLRVIRNRENLGFAAASNQGFREAFRETRITGLALLNNDAIIEPNWLERLSAQIDDAASIGMVASRMMRMEGQDRVDSLGIAFYRSGIASNRPSLDCPLLGPCGGAALYSRQLLLALARPGGKVFDELYFCYAEDTELALRARAVGARCAFVNDAVVRHWGAKSSGGPRSAFIAYHGLRNSLYNLVKHFPLGFWLQHAPAILLVQCAVIAQYLIKGKPSIIFRVYRDTFRRLPDLLRERRANCRPGSTPWRTFVCPRIYDPTYIRGALREIFHRNLTH